MVTIQETIKSIEDGINAMENLIETLNGGYVIESDWHIHVGKDLGLNGTEYAVKCTAVCAKATIFKSLKDAENRIDYNLIDGNRKPIYLGIAPAVDFFRREIENGKKLLVFINGR